MKTLNTLAKKTRIEEPSTVEVTKNFYDEATEDYKFWSSDFNMHFGYYIPFKTNFLKRDTMLNQMNKQILNRLELSTNKNLIADLGCGMGGTMRYAITNFTSRLSYILGVTLSPFQVKEGNKLLDGLNGLILEENYNHTTFKDHSIDGAFAVESFCHDGHDRTSFKEAYRILKPGATLVIADAFLKKSPEKLCRVSRYCYRKLCEGWGLKRLGTTHEVRCELESLGFKIKGIEDISFRVAPSVLHVPFAITGFILRKILTGSLLKKESFANLKGSLFALLSGLHMKSFGYYFISVTK
jgi:cyclopropane fatty-acyl-phospholipid synthase-like methyltransferase